MEDYKSNIDDQSSCQMDDICHELLDRDGTRRYSAKSHKETKGPKDLTLQ